jgi:hypothetical protein
LNVLALLNFVAQLLVSGFQLGGAFLDPFFQHFVGVPQGFLRLLALDGVAQGDRTSRSLFMDRLVR